ncbi:MAG: AAA family ATPase [Desulfobacterales bacterium]|nr:AAA family ATPase [Desulfobacterales bacterium]
MKFPYGISDFKAITTQGYFYCDRTDKIPLLEDSKSQLFIRPRRFGKSLVLSMLENYYDVAKADEFDEIFGNLAIGKNPTELRNSYFILRWDFSCIDTTGSIKEIKQALYDHINFCIKGFLLYYRDYNLPEVEVDRNNCINSINSLISSVRMAPYPIYLLIDEYDNFANTIMMGVQNKKIRYNALVHDEGVLRTLFKAIKSSTSGSMFDRVFITGVSPVVLSDITSGYNIAKDIYFKPKFNDLCGFKQNEVRGVIEQIVAECDFDTKKTDDALALMKTYYNGYLFALGLDEYIYNPTLCLYFFEQFREICSYPRKMLDSNLAVDESKLEYIAAIPMGRNILLSMMQKNYQVTVEDISDRFGVREMLSDNSKDNTFLASFLYYFGVLTLAGENPEGDVILKVPNLVIQSLYVERVQKMLLPEPGDRDDGKFAAKQVYQKGNMQHLCDFVENRYFTVFKNRDYRWANELTLKTAFLTLLYNDILYVMDSEPEIDRRYADLTMIIRPDKKHFKIFDVLIEFKFVRLKDAGITGEQAKQLPTDELYSIPEIKKALEEGEKQVTLYGKELDDKYGNLHLKKFVVTSLGFERVCFKKI